METIKTTFQQERVSAAGKKYLATTEIGALHVVQPTQNTIASEVTENTRALIQECWFTQ